MTQLNKALSALHADIWAGGEFPDAAYRCAGRYGVKQLELEKLYHRACEENIEHTCPMCGGHSFRVVTEQWASVEFLTDGDHDAATIDGDIEFDDDSQAVCDDCDHFGKLGDMK